MFGPLSGVGTGTGVMTGGGIAGTLAALTMPLGSLTEPFNPRAFAGPGGMPLTPASWAGDLEGGAPVRLTYYDGWDGLPSLSPNGRKMVFARAEPNKGGTWLNVMDVSSLNLGPENYKGVK